MDAVLARTETECSQVELWLHLYLDDECGPEERTLLEQHLATCEACTARLTLLEKTRAGLRRAAEEHSPPAPPALVARVQRDLADAKGPPAWPVWVAAALVLAVVFGGLGVWLGSREGPTDPLVADSVARHTLDVPVDVASPDAARVEAWLRPRLKEPISVPRLDELGLGLRGGRVVHIEGQRAAQLLYHGGLGRRVSVTAIPDHQGKLQQRLHWRAREIFSPSLALLKAQGFEVGTVRVGPTLYTVVDDKEGQALEIAQYLGR